MFSIFVIFLIVCVLLRASRSSVQRRVRLVITVIVTQNIIFIVRCNHGAVYVWLAYVCVCVRWFIEEKDGDEF